MIDWILGVLIFGAALFVIARMVIKAIKGESTCCSGCNYCKQESCHYRQNCNGKIFSP